MATEVVLVWLRRCRSSMRLSKPEMEIEGVEMELSNLKNKSFSILCLVVLAFHLLWAQVILVS